MTDLDTTFPLTFTLTPSEAARAEADREAILADPTAAILSVALLLDHLGVPDAAGTVRDAVTADIATRQADHPRTTSAVGDAIRDAVAASLAR